MSAPVKSVRIMPQHERGESRIEVSVQIGASARYNVGNLTVEEAYALAEQALVAARIVTRVNEEKSAGLRPASTRRSPLGFVPEL